MSLDKFQLKIGYQFNNIDLLIVSLTHRSKGAEHNERLEFLGDSILNFVIAENIYLQYPEASEGELTRMRSAIVCGSSLCDIATKLEIGDLIILGLGELSSGGRARSSILSDSVEALIGAIFLDGGIVFAKKFILEWFKNSLRSVDTKSHLKDPKTNLQEFSQRLGICLPEYRVIGMKGPEHQKIFEVSY